MQKYSRNILKDLILFSSFPLISANIKMSNSNLYSTNFSLAQSFSEENFFKFIQNPEYRIYQSGIFGLNPDGRASKSSYFFELNIRHLEFTKNMQDNLDEE